MPSEGALAQPHGIGFHFQEVVLPLPHKRYAPELSERVPLILLAFCCFLPHALILLPRRQHKIENELLTPHNQTLNDIKAQHSERVQNIDAFVKKVFLVYSYCLLVLNLGGLLHQLADLESL